MNSGFFDRLIERLDRLDPDSLQIQFLRLAREKGLLETIFHAMQEGLVVLDGRGRIAYANRSAERLLGFTLSTALGTRIGRYLRDIEWDRVLKLDGREWSGMLNREIEVNYPEHRFLAFYVVPLKGEKASDNGAVLILRDITRDRQHEAKSIESERLRAITLLAAGVAHEIGNPLNSLTIHLQLLRREMAALPEKSRADLTALLDVSTREVERLDRIITQFLSAVRPVKPQLESAAFDEILQETLSFMRQEVADRNVIVECEVEQGLPSVKVDRGQIRQMLFNIIKNAAEAMPDGGVLRVEVASNDRSIRASFRDTGVGMDPAQMSRIFEPYNTTKARGSGLGLMIVQRIVRDHGGELEIHSQPGRGTTVTLYLPREDCLIRLLHAPKRAPEAGPGAAVSPPAEPTTGGTPA